MTIVNLYRFKADGDNKTGWSNQETAEFYRVADIMNAAGLSVSTDFGLSDEGDPWLVFVRQETGDVIAHFARLDGLFISVSSITSEIYRGQDARSVVDQMLARHPLMIPKTSAGGTLYLHPSVGLTAFVAAAFLITLDGVRAESVDDILISALSNQSSISSDGSSSPRLESAKVEVVHAITRGPFVDLSPTASHLAAIGTALINQQIFSPLEHLNLIELEYAGDFNQEIASSVKMPDAPFALEQAVNRELGGFGMDELNSHFDDVKGDESSTDTTKTVSYFELDEKFYLLKLEQIFSDNEQMESSAEQGLSFTISTVEQKFDKQEAQSTYNFHSVEANHGDQNLSHESSNLNPFQFVFDSFRSAVNFEETPLGISDSGFGIAIGKQGKLLLVELENSNVSGESEFISLIESNEKTGVDSQAPSQIAANEVQKPIIGHQLVSNAENPIILTDAIDVVFYEGGNSQVSGFDLGTDLLWFFLSQDLITNARTEIENGKDLLLNFGEIGTLTLVNVLGDNIGSDIYF